MSECAKIAKWMPVDGFNTDCCGCDIEVHTTRRGHIETLYDDDVIRCTNCGCYGSVDIDCAADPPVARTSFEMFAPIDDYLTLQRERDELKKITGRYRKCEKCGYQFLIQPAQSIVPCPNCQKVELKRQRDDLQAIVDKLAEVFHFDNVSQDHYEQGGGDEYDLELSDCYGKLADETWKELYKMVRAAEAAKGGEG